RGFPGLDLLSEDLQNLWGTRWRRRLRPQPGSRGEGQTDADTETKDILHFGPTSEGSTRGFPGSYRRGSVGNREGVCVRIFRVVRQRLQHHEFGLGLVTDRVRLARLEIDPFSFGESEGVGRFGLDIHRLDRGAAGDEKEEDSGFLMEMIPHH